MYALSFMIYLLHPRGDGAQLLHNIYIDPKDAEIILNFNAL